MYILVEDNVFLFNIKRNLTEYDRARQTFFLVKFLPPQFFLEIILGLWAKVGGSEKIPPAGPLGGQGARKALGPPKWGIVIFDEKKFFFGWMSSRT